MKILLFGKNGQVGWELQRSLALLGEVVALDVDSTEACGDFTNPDGLAQTVRELHPDVVVNAAAHTAVDRAQSEPDLAHTINATAPQVLANAAEAVGAWMVHYSTDYVFDGSGQTPWREVDAPRPINVYGQTKLEGERAVQCVCQRHLIFRTSWVYAARGANFAKTMFRLAQERTELRVVDDQIGAPTGAELLADATAHALRVAIAGRDEGMNLAGLYHLCAQGHTSWHGYAQFVVQVAQEMGVALKVTPGSVLPVPSLAYPTAAQRPLNSRLDCSKVRSLLGLNLPPWQWGVLRMLQEVQLR